MPKTAPQPGACQLTLGLNKLADLGRLCPQLARRFASAPRQVKGLVFNPLSAADLFRPIPARTAALQVDPARQGRPEHLAQRMQIIGGHPAEEFQLAISPERLIIQHINNLFQPGKLAIRCECQQIAGQLAPAKGDKDPLARLRLGGQVSRDKIMKGLVHRQWQGDFDDNGIG